VRDRRGGSLADSEHAPRELARSRRKAHGDDAARERRVERRDDLCAVEHGRGARRERDGLGVRMASRVHEHEPRQAHRVHRAGGAAHVAGMAGRDQDDAQGLEAIEQGRHRDSAAMAGRGARLSAVTMIAFLPSARSAASPGGHSEPT
jgi:hypothetical protein